jgi:arylsulfatase A-like enzyme
MAPTVAILSAMGDNQFGGRIGRTWRESEPWWPPEPTPPPGAPNVVMVVLDDVGFAQLGCYGSEIETPVFDRLAAEGVQLANFHTTALCSPTRACLLTGRNHHSNGMGRITDLALGYPGYSGRIPRQNGFLSEMLATRGYVPVAVGKWHVTPEDQTHQAARRDTWPCARGFQRWYGFHGGETHQFVPSLFEDNHSVVPPATPAQGYHLTEDLADRAIRYLGDIRSAAPESPFFLYLATGACHSPHQAPAEWIDRYRGRFDGGWDSLRERVFSRQLDRGLLPEGTRLSGRPHWVPAWDDLADEDRWVAARFMECFAGFLSHADAQVGRVLDFIRALGEWDDTLVVVVSDNGASAEGGPIGSINDVRLWNLAPAGPGELRARIDELGTPTAHNNYPWGWTMAGNTPFRRWKREVHQGGVADPCLISWPARIPAGTGPRRQFAHAIDIVPTVLDLIGMAAPASIDGVAQAPVEGVSQAAVLLDPDAAEVHDVQYFEMFGSRALYQDGWKAVTFHPFIDMYQEGRDPDLSYEDDIWELYHVSVDPSETEDRARAEPDRLARMKARWWEEAERYQVLPLDHRLIEALMDPRHFPVSRREHTFYPGGSIVPEYRVTPLRGRAHRIEAHVDLPASGPSGQPGGVLVAMGTGLGGWSFQLLDGRPRYVNNFVGASVDVIEAPAPVRPGRHVLGVEFTPAPAGAGDGPAGVVRLLVDGAEVASGPLGRVPIARYNLTGGGLTCGWEQGPAVGPGYEAPFPFRAGLDKVVIRTDEAVDGGPEPSARLDAILAEQ